MSNSFGRNFIVTTFGESHGHSVGVVIDGCPPRFGIDLSQIQSCLLRRRPGQSHLTSPRMEQDQVVCLSGLDANSQTLGGPLAFTVKNHDAKSQDYRSTQNTFRPSHADFTYFAKYGIPPQSGGGRSSARETIGRVIAGSVAEQILSELVPSLRITAYVESIYNLTATLENPLMVTRDIVDQSLVRCPDQAMSLQMQTLLEKIKSEGDSVGGVIRCIIQGVPRGLGDPVFDKLQATLAKALMSLPAAKGFEFGDGFAATKLLGSEHNDAFISDEAGHIKTMSNHSGGIQGGISNGEPILLGVAFKPVSTIRKTQQTVTTTAQNVSLSPTEGRHDPCVLPRAVPIVESMVACVLFDHFLRQRSLMFDDHPSS